MDARKLPGTCTSSLRKPLPSPVAHQHLHIHEAPPQPPLQFSPEGRLQVETRWQSNQVIDFWMVALAALVMWPVGLLGGSLGWQLTSWTGAWVIEAPFVILFGLAGWVIGSYLLVGLFLGALWVIVLPFRVPGMLYRKLTEGVN